MSKKKKFWKNALPYLMVFTLMFSFLSFITLVSPHAALADDFTNGAKLGTTGNGAITDIMNELKKWITNIRIVGAVLCVISIVCGAIVFGFSLGNAQKRAIGTGAMISAVIGIVVIAKAPMLADYFINAATAAPTTTTQ
ncbi:pilin [Paenibacillus sp. GP183]|uniref:pilin n=1 Tax=Paenibacillus sp. GP183 TaxID=1882751 RepID=UPI00089A4A68|nr:pilin [Paenibacillus sp. GP183]SED06160.1 hypothetical protein SAMN05443246_5537 [Paenibacillus sp. GP183]